MGMGVGVGVSVGVQDLRQECVLFKAQFKVLALCSLFVFRFMHACLRLQQKPASVRIPSSSHYPTIGYLQRPAATPNWQAPPSPSWAA